MSSLNEQSSSVESASLIVRLLTRGVGSVCISYLSDLLFFLIRVPSPTLFLALFFLTVLIRGMVGSDRFGCSVKLASDITGRSFFTLVVWLYCVPEVFYFLCNKRISGKEESSSALLIVMSFERPLGDSHILLLLELASAECSSKSFSLLM